MNKFGPQITFLTSPTNGIYYFIFNLLRQLDFGRVTNWNSHFESNPNQTYFGAKRTEI